MFDITGLFNYFTRPVSSAFQTYDGYQDGYESANTFLLSQKVNRVKAISEGRIFDFIQVENDPNFGRSKSTGSSLNTLFSKLGMATSLVTIINAKMYMAGITEFIPTNINSLLQNFQSITDTGVNLLSTLQNGNIFKQIESSFLNDLTLQFGNNTVTFQQISQISDVLSDRLQLQEDIQNNGIRPLLALGLQNFLPDSMLSIFEDAQYLDYLAYIFDDEADQKAVTDFLSAETTVYGQSKLNTLIVDDYSDLTVGINDPMGIVAKDGFANEIINSYQEFIEGVMDDLAVNFELTVDQKDDLTVILLDDANENINAALRGKIALPSLTECVKGVKSDVNNMTAKFIQSSFNKFADKVINELGIKGPLAGTKPLDYLINLKTNIKLRIEMKRQGDTTENFVAIDNYFKTVLLDGKLTEQKLDELNNHIDDLLKENARNSI